MMATTHSQQVQMDQVPLDAGGSNRSTLVSYITANSPTSLDDDKSTEACLGSITGEIMTKDPETQSTASPSNSTLSLTSTAVPEDLIPLAPSNNPRYADVNFVPKKIEVIDAGLRASTLDDLPPGWEVYIHPEGKPYYHDETRNIATYANMRDSKISGQVEGAFQKLKDAITVAWDSHYELVIEVSKEGCCYYFVDHQSLSICWPGKVEVSHLGVDGFNSDVQRDLWLQKEYWHHLHNFPFHNKLPRDAASQLTDALLYGGVDHASSQTSMFPFTDAQRETYLGALKAYQKGEVGYCKGHQNSTVAEARFLSHHGHDAARIDRGQMIGVAKQDTWILRCLQTFARVLLFNTPNAHHLHLKRLWLGRIVMSEQWEKFAKELLTEWSETTLLATVLLAADVSFWSVAALKFWAQLGIWISAVFALGSIVTALLQSRQHRGRVLAPALDVATYMDRVETKTLALLPLAVTYAFPYCLLMWSVTWFAVGMVIFAVETFWESKVGKVAIIYMAVMGTLPIVFSALYAWSIRLRQPSVAESGTSPWSFASGKGSSTQAGSDDTHVGQQPRPQSRKALTRRLTSLTYMLTGALRAATTTSAPGDLEMQKDQCFRWSSVKLSRFKLKEPLNFNSPDPSQLHMNPPLGATRWAQVPKNSRMDTRHSGFGVRLRSWHGSTSRSQPQPGGD
ncbi:hypothetical protein BOTBODRAFT_641510 [Botryobasidium botryosum FD-172 SS1]|uniref:WW domain-containing protein n=1 Tax=Botryobasidium botryosum (strain FD-172 SS1) TaxID=930990 RepID=A0A067N2Q1_BOTB1|nr:hypothetical protein BOTBODRAFT_641510 [Botryobasidium botryosum FD-172 SS1]